jgi:uncharacterized membrane protein YuzA (DUF378 family)
MTIGSIACPSCGQLIRNATVNAAGRLRCGACEHLFVVQNVPGIPEVSAIPAPAAVASAPAVETVAYREPPPAHYGLLTAAAWFAGGAAVLLAALHFMNLKGAPLVTDPLTALRSTRFGPPSTAVKATDVLPYLARMLEIGLLALAAFGLMSAVEHITRIDRLSAALAWKWKALRKPLGNPPGRSLSVLLPFAVLGGLVLIAGLQLVVANHEVSLSSGDRSGSWQSDFTFAGPLAGLVIAVVGAALMLLGLGAGELRRFLWRMHQFGAAIAHRRGKPDAALAAEGRAPAGASIASASLLVAGLLLCAAGLVQTFQLDLLTAYTGGSYDLGPARAAYIVGIAALFTLSRLAALYASAVNSWAPDARNLPAQPMARVFRFLMWTCVAGALFYNSWTFGGYLPGVEYGLGNFESFLRLAAALTLLYFGSAAFDLSGFSAVTAELAGARRKPAASAVNLANLLLIAVIVVAAMRAAAIWDEVGAKAGTTAAAAATRWSGAGTVRVGGGWSEALATVFNVLSTAFLALLPVVPAANLEAAGDRPPPATS